MAAKRKKTASSPPKTKTTKTKETKETKEKETKKKSAAAPKKKKKKKTAAATGPAPKTVAKGGKKAKVDPSGKEPALFVSEIEKEVAALLEDYDAGNVDNAFDVVGDMYEMDKKLPKTSPLRKRFDKMYKDIVEICAEYG